MAVVLAVLLVAGAITLWLRRRGRRSVRRLTGVTLDPGVYLFTSTGCPTCGAAREKLAARLGDRGFEEYVWEEGQGPFTELGVDALPAVLVVRAGGAGELYEGRPELALRTL